MKFLITISVLFFNIYVLAATDPKMAFSMLNDGKAVIVDVREKNEIKSGMIDKALWFPKSKMQSDPNWKKDFINITDGKKIFLYCQSGKRSGECQEILKKNGIESESLGGYEQLKKILPTKIPKG